MTRWQAILAALKNGGWVNVLGTLAGIAVTVGILTADQSQAIIALFTGVLNVVQLLGTVVSTFRHAAAVRTAESYRRMGGANVAAPRPRHAE